MAAYAIKNIDEMEATWRGAFKLARAELGVEAFGLQVIDMPPNIDQFPEHDHAEDGMQEVYVPVSGSGEIEIDGERHPLEPGSMVMVNSGVMRKVITGDQPIRLIAIGGVPGKAYEAPDQTQLGAPDPLQQQAN
jgi:mannose-6-phosphate isomerase-like protein (cupin superfamily)